MKRVLTYSSIVLLCYFVFLLITFPADRAYSMAKSMMPNVALYGVRGTVWAGEADAVVLKDKQPLREFEWTVLPWHILMGRLAADVKFDNNRTWVNARVAYSVTGKVIVSRLSGQLDGEALQSLLPNNLPMKLGGLFRMNVDEVVYSPEQQTLLAAEGQVNWQNASIKVMQEAKIGDFQLIMTTTDAGVHGAFTDVNNEGPLMVQGDVVLSPEKQYELNAKLKVRDAARQDLVQSLRFIGRADAQGFVVFNKKGEL